MKYLPLSRRGTRLPTSRPLFMLFSLQYFTFPSSLDGHLLLDDGKYFSSLALTQGLAKGRLFKNTLIINCDQKSCVKDNNIYIFAHTYVCDVNVCVYVCAYVHKYVHTKSLLSGLTNSGVTGATTFRAGLKDNWTPKSLGPELHQFRMYPKASGKTSLSISCSLCL